MSAAAPAGPRPGGRDADAPDALERWLAGRRPPPPPPVARSIAEAMARLDPGSGSVPERLAEAGLSLLGAVAAGPGDRGTAGDLLAADALLTYALEAAAEEGQASLDRLLDGLAVDRFEDLLTGRDGEP